MTNETNKQLSETKQLRGTFDQVIRQINETYNASNGWAIARTSSVLVNFSVWLERSVKQADSKVETPVKDAVAEVETNVVKTAPKTTAKKATEKKDV
ncbi:MAG: hypothetical protein RR140_04170 [Clostridia bacterium]